MQRYKDFQPTPNDIKGLGLPDRQEWFVYPVMLSKNGTTLDISNFISSEEIFESIDPEEINFENKKFNHWGPGWFEIILINPECTDLVKKAEELIKSLEDHPVLNEDHYTKLILEEEWEECIFLEGEEE